MQYCKNAEVRSFVILIAIFKVWRIIHYILRWSNVHISTICTSCAGIDYFQTSSVCNNSFLPQRCEVALNILQGNNFRMTFTSWPPEVCEVCLFSLPWFSWLVNPFAILLWGSPFFESMSAFVRADFFFDFGLSRRSFLFFEDYKRDKNKVLISTINLF